MTKNVILYIVLVIVKKKDFYSIGDFRNYAYDSFACNLLCEKKKNVLH
ncbi:hypothetical protein NC652_007375 [Populus alba x Populus x berolinensis]|nr:hypothetical protein NC652_007375 [Populus alba x Populus x berolinensis]